MTSTYRIKQQLEMELLFPLEMLTKDRDNTVL